MKKVFLTFILCVVFGLPMLAPFAPHDMLHRLHDGFEAHHSTNAVHQTENILSKKSHKQKEIIQDHHHPVHFDIVTYFKDYLHVDLQKTQTYTLAIQKQSKSPDFNILDSLIVKDLFVFSPVRNTPPYYGDVALVAPQIYKTTQRIRI
tara:strand:- start:40835 stop:41278 length:444 start_codon:yes stop_codon:yes gene_type:complete